MLNADAKIYTPYGSTEALPVAEIAHEENLGVSRAHSARGAGTCVGRPLPDLTVKIARISDAPIPLWANDLECPVGEVGEICVSGPNATGGYYGRPAATALAKIP